MARIQRVVEVERERKGAEAEGCGLRILLKRASKCVDNSMSKRMSQRGARRSQL
jgi:hypothetical protein